MCIPFGRRQPQLVHIYNLNRTSTCLQLLVGELPKVHGLGRKWLGGPVQAEAKQRLSHIREKDETHTHNV